MKSVLLATLTLFCCSCGVQQVAPKKLTDSYAVAALTSLKAIEGDTFVQKPGSNLVSRFTQEKIDAADALAVSGEEKHITDTLNQIYAAKVNFNWQVVRKDRYLKLVQTNEALVGIVSSADRQYDRAMASQRSQEVSNFSDQLDRCFSDFDPSLRARAVEVPPSCKVAFNKEL